MGEDVYFQEFDEPTIYLIFYSHLLDVSSEIVPRASTSTTS